MDLKRKKIIFWSVVITLFISTFLLIWVGTSSVLFEGGILNGRVIQITLSLTILSLPPVLFYRLLIGRIPVTPHNDSLPGYVLFVFLQVVVSFILLINWFDDYFFNPPKWVVPILGVLILIYGIHKISRRIIFKFMMEEDETI